MKPSPPSTGPSGSTGRRSSAFVREPHAPIDARGRPALSRSAGCVLSDPRGATWACKTICSPGGPNGEIKDTRSALENFAPRCDTEDDACTLRANSNALGSQSQEDLNWGARCVKTWANPECAESSFYLPSALLPIARQADR